MDDQVVIDEVSQLQWDPSSNSVFHPYQVPLLPDEIRNRLLKKSMHSKEVIATKMKNYRRVIASLQILPGELIKNLYLSHVLSDRQHEEIDQLLEEIKEED